ncbi:hypothetical protein ACP275_13G136900 [Erythranthe tilingii]
MESCSLLSFCQLSILPPKKVNNYRALPPLLKQRSSHSTTTLQCHKMYVPGFGEASPEAKAAKHLHDFFTYVAVRIVHSQLESYNEEAYAEMVEFLETHSLSDGGDNFVADLLRQSSTHKTLALRILEVRSAYCKNDFEWDNLKRLSIKMVEERNTKVMRDYVTETSTVNTETET